MVASSTGGSSNMRENEATLTPGTSGSLAAQRDQFLTANSDFSAGAGGTPRPAPAPPLPSRVQIGAASGAGATVESVSTGVKTMIVNDDEDTFSKFFKFKFDDRSTLS